MELKGELSKVIECVHTVTEVKDLSTKNKGRLLRVNVSLLQIIVAW